MLTGGRLSMEVLHIGFTGTSNGMTAAQKTAFLKAFDDLVFRAPASDGVAFHHGDCVGADAEANDLVSRRFPDSVQIVIHPPDSPRMRAFRNPPGCTILLQAPYLVRNHAIVDACSRLLACPYEATGETLRSGTWATIRYARKKTVPTNIIRPDGSWHPGDLLTSTIT